MKKIRLLFSLAITAFIFSLSVSTVCHAEVTARMEVKDYPKSKDGKSYSYELASSIEVPLESSSESVVLEVNRYLYPKTDLFFYSIKFYSSDPNIRLTADTYFENNSNGKHIKLRSVKPSHFRHYDISWQGFSNMTYVSDHMLQQGANFFKTNNDKTKVTLVFENRDPITFEITPEMRREWKLILFPNKTERDNINNAFEEWRKDYKKLEPQPKEKIYEKQFFPINKK